MKYQINRQVISLLSHIKFTNNSMLSQAIETAKKLPSGLQVGALCNISTPQFAFMILITLTGSLSTLIWHT